MTKIPETNFTKNVTCSLLCGNASHMSFYLQTNLDLVSEMNIFSPEDRWFFSFLAENANYCKQDIVLTLCVWIWNADNRSKFSYLNKGKENIEIQILSYLDSSQKLHLNEFKQAFIICAIFHEIVFGLCDIVKTLSIFNFLSPFFSVPAYEALKGLSVMSLVEYIDPYYKYSTAGCEYGELAQRPGVLWCCLVMMIH